MHNNPFGELDDNYLMEKFEDLIKKLGENALYKFMPYNQFTLETLINKRLYFGDPNYQNDPLESHYIIDTSKVSEHFVRHFPEDDEMQKELNRIRFSRLVINNEIEDKVGICCFSKKNEEYLLWSHYANGAKGICLLFDREMLIKDLKNENETLLLKDVKYDGLPTITPIIDKKLEGFNIESIVFNKLTNWKYEDEVRAMCIVKSKNLFGRESTKRLLYYSEKSLRGIILGERFAIESKKTIKNIVKSCFENEIPIYRLDRDKGNPENVIYR